MISDLYGMYNVPPHISLFFHLSLRVVAIYNASVFLA